MNTRQRMEAMNARRQAPVGMAMRPPPAEVPFWPQRHSFCAPGMEERNGECVASTCATQAHPLVNARRNQELSEYEHTVRTRFDVIVPVLKAIAALQHEDGFERQAQQIAQERLGFGLPADVLADAWVTALDMRKLYGHSVLQTYHALACEFGARLDAASDAEAAQRFFIECGFHEVDISACADGRLKGLLQFILRLPHRSVRRHKSYAGAMFDVELNVKQWVETELRRYREGLPTLSDAGTRYLKVAVYHFSSSDPLHEGCAAHGSDAQKAARAALERLAAFRTAIENGFCCGASVATLLIGVDTDNDAIKVHVPDSDGGMDETCCIDNLEVYRQTAGMTPEAAQRYLGDTIGEAARKAGRSAPEAGMRRLIERLLANNLSQIDYVCVNHNGRYADIGHAERFINIGDGFDEVHLRNLAYFGHMYTVEEGLSDLDVGIGIFRKLNVVHGLPIPVAIHYRYDENVPGSRERAVARCLRVRREIEMRYPSLAGEGLLFCGMTVQGKEYGAAQEQVAEAPESNMHSTGVKP